MYLVYATISDQDAIDYEPLMDKKEQQECKDLKAVKEYIEYLKWAADDPVQVSIDEISEDGNMKTVKRMVLNSRRN